MDAYEAALIAVDDARRELAEAEWSGDHEAVLIWRRTVEDAVREASDVQFFGGWER